MNNASTGDARGTERPTDAEPFFPSEGPFSTVVPLSEVGRTPAVRGGGADAGRPAEAEWARAADRAERADAREEETLVPARSRRARTAPRGPREDEGRRSWAMTALVILVSVAAGVVSGAYLLSSSGRAPSARQTAPPRIEEAQAAAEAPAPQPAPVLAAPPPTEAVEGRTNVAAEKAVEAEKVEKVEKKDEAASAASAARETRAAPAESARAVRPARPPAEAEPVRTAPKPAPRRAAAPPTRTVTRAQRQPAAASAERTLPVSSAPPSAKSKKVIQWP